MELHIPEPSVGRAVFAKANLLVPAESIPELTVHLQPASAYPSSPYVLAILLPTGVASMSADKEVGHSNFSAVLFSHAVYLI